GAGVGLAAGDARANLGGQRLGDLPGGVVGQGPLAQARGLFEGPVGDAGFGGDGRQRDQQGGGKQGKAHSGAAPPLGKAEPSKPRRAAPVRLVTGAAGPLSAVAANRGSGAAAALPRSAPAARPGLPLPACGDGPGG